MDRQALAIAAVTGAAAQLILVLVGHFVAFVADNLFAVGGLAISLAAGLIYVRRAPDAERPLLGGAAAGAICAFVGILVSILLGDVAAIILILGVLASAAAGAGGAALGEVLAARKGSGG